MKYLKLIFLVIIVFQFKIETNAQISIRERQEIYNETLKILDIYESAFSIKNKRNYVDFLRLFTNTKIEIFNDIMPENSLDKKIKLGSYFNFWREHYYDKKILFMNLYPYEMGPVFFYNDANDSGYLNVSAYKIFNSKTDKGIVYVDTFDINKD